MNNAPQLQGLGSVPGHSEEVVGKWSLRVQVEGFSRVRAMVASEGCLFTRAWLVWDRGSEKRLQGQCQGSLSRRGQQVSFPSSMGKVRLKTRWSHRCSQAGC